MSDLSLKFKSSSGFPLRRQIEVRPGVHLLFSSGIIDRKFQWVTATTGSIFELAYSQKNSLYSEVGNVPVEVKPGYSNLGFLGETKLGHSLFGLNHIYLMLSVKQSAGKKDKISPLFKILIARIIPFVKMYRKKYC